MTPLQPRSSRRSPFTRRLRERRREVRVELPVPDVADHDRVRQLGVDEGPEGLQLRIGPRGGDVDHALIGIARGAPLPREVLDGAPDRGPVMGLDDRARMGDHDRRIGGEAPVEGADRGVVRVEVQVDDGRQVDVDSGTGEVQRRQRRDVGRVDEVVCGPERFLRLGGGIAVGGDSGARPGRPPDRRR